MRRIYYAGHFGHDHTYSQESRLFFVQDNVFFRRDGISPLDFYSFAIYTYIILIIVERYWCEIWYVFVIRSLDCDRRRKWERKEKEIKYRSICFHTVISNAAFCHLLCTFLRSGRKNDSRSLKGLCSAADFVVWKTQGQRSLRCSRLGPVSRRQKEKTHVREKACAWRADRGEETSPAIPWNTVTPPSCTGLHLDLVSHEITKWRNRHCVQWIEKRDYFSRQHVRWELETSRFFEMSAADVFG